jgi:arylformamidase
MTARRIIFRDFDQATLDAQYNLRAACPDHPQFFARWAAASAAVRRRLPCRLDLAYGPAPREQLDFFPAAVNPAPLLVFFHGGYWQAMDKSDFSFIATAFHQRAIATALVNYTLAPAAPIGAMVDESRAALAWLVHHAPSLGIDPGRIGIAGHSAGGHLAAMLMLTDWAGCGLADPVRLACAVSGIFDLAPIRLSYLNRILKLRATDAVSLSPARLLPRNPLPAGQLLLAVGGGETAEFHRQQAEFAALWRSRGAPPLIVDLPRDHHFSIVDRLAEPDSALFGALAGAISRW